jgi:DNA-binding winged helix-turn-helix (wHTH) protein/TolB-like protein/Tfp pilus assembly protein PilF
MVLQDKQLHEFDRFLLDPQRQRLTSDGEPLPLPPKAVELLILLVRNVGKVVEKDALIAALWPDTAVEESNLTQHIYLLRKALGKTAEGTPFIETFSKRGYRFVCAVHSAVRSNDEEHSIPPAAPQTEGVVRAKRRSWWRYGAFAGLLAAAAGLVLSLRTFAFHAATAPLVQSIAVMPFESFGAPPEEVLSLGMPDVIVARLGKTGKILVSPTEAIRRYVEKGDNAITAARSLHVESVLTGSIQHQGDRVRVTLQLIRSGDGQVIWVDQFDENGTDLFAVQDLVSRRLAEALRIRLDGDERRRLTQPETGNTEAYQFNLRGWYYWNKRTPEPVQKAIRSFEDAVRLDPKYALAYAGLADSYAVTASGLPPAERFPKAKDAAQKALAIDPDSAEAHTSLAFTLYKSELKWPDAENHFRRAIQLNPSYALAHHWFGEFLVLSGRFEEGLKELGEAARLDPLSLAIQSDLARSFYRARRYDESITQARRALELDPNFSNAYATLAYAYEQKKMYAESVQADLEVQRLANVPPDEIAKLRRAFASSGWMGYWGAQLDLATKQARTRYVRSYVLAEIYLRLNNRDAAFRAIEKSYEEAGDAPLQVRVEPLLDQIRGDARFDMFVKRAGFALR